MFRVYFILFGLLAGCAPLKQANGLSTSATSNEVEKMPTAISADLLVPSPMAAAALPDLPRTNGIIRLAWDAGTAPQVLVNQTTRQSYDAGAAASLTLGGQLANTPQTYVVTNFVGASNPVTAVPEADTNRLAFAPYIFRAHWSGPAGVLQESADLVIWQDRGAIQSGASVLITNDATQAFFRVRHN